MLFVGRLEQEKGVRRAARGLAARRPGPGARLALAGRGPLAPARRTRAGASGRLGYVGRSELPALYAAADVLVLPSVRTATFMEPWGLVVNEAMLQSTPVIASDAVGAAAGGLVRDGRNGLVFPAGDAAGARRPHGDAWPARRAARAAGRRPGASAARELTPRAWAEGAAGRSRASERPDESG